MLQDHSTNLEYLPCAQRVTEKLPWATPACNHDWLCCPAFQMNFAAMTVLFTKPVCDNVLGSGAQGLPEAAGASVRSGWGCLVLSTAGSSSSNPPTAGHGWAPQPPWQRLGESLCKEGQNIRRKSLSFKGRGGDPGTGVGVPLQSLERPWWSWCPHCTHGGPHTGEGEKSAEDGAAERSWCGLSKIPIPPLLHHSVAGEAEELGIKKWTSSSFCLCFSPSNSVLIGNKLN